MADFRFPLSLDSDGKRTSTHVSVNPYLLTIITSNEPDGIEYDGHQAVTIDTTYNLSLAADGTRGGVQVGYSANGQNYPVQLSDEKMYVNVPWTDNDTKDTAGSTDSSTKLFLIGAGSQTNHSQTYSNINVYATNGILHATKVENAIWNDYAEMRKTNVEVKYGQCVIDNDDGSLSIANKRLLPGAQVVSDTWGHIMGETEEAQTPVAVAGRVLVYPYRDRSEYHAGMSVCTAPNGTVDIMTREEIMQYPDCIVGIVSEIPNYEFWGSGNVNVNGRIWIKVK